MSVPVPQRVVSGCHHQSFAFSGSSVNDLAYIDEVLGLFEDPVDLIVVACTCVDHYMFVPVEKHEGHLVVQFVHGVEIWYFGDVNYIESNEFAEFIGHLHDDFIHYHAVGVPVVTKTNDN